MIARIFSLNVGAPAPIEYKGKTIQTSMHKRPVPGPLVVSPTSIQGDTFAQPELHGTPCSVLYAFGKTSAEAYLKLLGLAEYEPGSLGENLTLDDFDETKISVGDVFQIGEVVAEATAPRIPCGKVNFRMQHPEGQKLLAQSGRSGVYFRILSPGKIRLGDEVKRMRQAEVPFTISETLRLVTTWSWSPEDLARAKANGRFADRLMKKLLEL